MKNKVSKNAIALLITIFFIMLITVSVGMSLKYVNEGTKSVHSETFLLQSRMVVEDVLKILKDSKSIAEIESAETLHMFINSIVPPLHSSGLNVIIEVKSARAKIHPTSLQNEKREVAFKEFLEKRQIDLSYASMLLDLVSGVKEDGGYNTDIFNKNTYLFRDFISSYKQLDALDIIYKKRYRNNNIDAFNTRELFYATTRSEGNYTIDINYATPQVWELMLKCSKERALVLSEHEFAYTSLADLSLVPKESLALANFDVDFYQPYLEVLITIEEGKSSAEVRFEYNIETKKGSNFVFTI